jgi:hypothetical protein
MQPKVFHPIMKIPAGQANIGLLVILIILFFLGSETRIKSGTEERWFSSECDTFCFLADSALTEMIDRISKGSISLQEMDSVFRRKASIEKLCLASSRDWSDIEHTLECRNEECTTFKHHKEVLLSFCRELKTCNVHVEGMSCACRNQI